MNPDNDDIRRQLAALPEISVPPALAERIGRARHRHIRRIKSGLMGAVVALACMTATPFLLRGLDPHTHTAMPADDEAIIQLHALDRALQAAYDSNANEEEITALWIARAHLLPSSPGPIDNI